MAALDVGASQEFFGCRSKIRVVSKGENRLFIKNGQFWSKGSKLGSQTALYSWGWFFFYFFFFWTDRSLKSVENGYQRTSARNCRNINAGTVWTPSSGTTVKKRRRGTTWRTFSTRRGAAGCATTTATSSPFKSPSFSLLPRRTRRGCLISWFIAGWIRSMWNLRRLVLGRRGQ